MFTFLSNKISILIVDDDKYIIDSMIEMFSSELFHITSSRNINDALTLIRNTTSVWHTWLIDLAIEREGDGIELIKQFKFPYTVVLSGLHSMGMASKAIHAGALCVFDKDPASLEQLHKTVCGTAALGYLLKGKSTQYYPVFSLLKSNDITSPEQWADLACITIRQLERICKLHSELTPRLFRPTFYALWFYLMNGITLDTLPKHFSAHPFSFESTRRSIQQVEKCLNEIKSDLN